MVVKYFKNLQTFYFHNEYVVFKGQVEKKRIDEDEDESNEEDTDYKSLISSFFSRHKNRIIFELKFFFAAFICVAIFFLLIIVFVETYIYYGKKNSK